jgi:hypothetical protein
LRTLIQICVLLVLAGRTLAATPASADEIQISSCSGQAKLPVTFSIDCSHVKDAEKQFCRPFIENQSCKVFGAYRKITGINLENECPSVKYTIYDKDTWPYKQGEASGYAKHCAAELMADYSLLIKSHLGPYDVHEILHVYQSGMGALPQPHALFGPSMLEAIREIGDSETYAKRLASMKQEAERLEDEFQKGTVKGNKCTLAETEFEERLYLENARYVHVFYRKLEPDKAKDQVSREARFNRMYNVVSEGKARKFLVDHGCAPF